MLKNYCKMCATLTSSDIEKIERVTETVSILSNILNMDVFIDCPTRDEEKAIVVYHARPETKSLYSKNIAGEIADSYREPAVFRSFMTGLPSKHYKALTQENENVLQNVVPVLNDIQEVIGVIIMECLENQENKFNTELFNQTANKLIEGIDVSRSKIPEFVKDGVVVFNKDGFVTYVNQVAKKIYSSLGFSKTIIGENFENITLTKSKLEKILYQKDEESIDISISGLILNISYFVTFLEEKNSSIVMIIRDITKEKNNEQELILKSVAIKEIHHRVKNNLQTIASLLRIQRRRVENDEAKKILEETINRILSIAITHEVLSDNGLDNLNIKKIIQLIYNNSFANSIDKIGRVEFNILGDDFNISSDKATSIALVVNELLQNAINYAFPKEENGRIDVTIEMKKFYSKVSIVDNGVGIDEERYRENSLGLMIVEKIVKDKLKGTFSLETKVGKGTKVEFEFKNE
ncbi:sensor histidine kinase [Cetobacterium sp. 2A]|uniref:sensor histidine kinase n=1 Tax=unclassified Cetobacterium TaxID=2630983 RepID=UPI00163CB04C|nr:sensor histidine kinase [Cetobacterium sp. 2A]MBC2855063.1 sensor histidine kinase [Cetobacterium sp. 2A]